MDRRSNKSDVIIAILSHFFCLLIGLAALGVGAWVIATDQLFTLDGLGLITISLVVAVFFAAHSAWAVYTGEIRDLFSQLRSRSEEAAPAPNQADPPDDKH